LQQDSIQSNKTHGGLDNSNYS